MKQTVDIISQMYAEYLFPYNKSGIIYMNTFLYAYKFFITYGMLLRSPLPNDHTPSLNVYLAAANEDSAAMIWK